MVYANTALDSRRFPGYQLIRVDPVWDSLQRMMMVMFAQKDSTFLAVVECPGETTEAAAFCGSSLSQVETIAAFYLETIGFTISWEPADERTIGSHQKVSHAATDKLWVVEQDDEGKAQLWFQDAEKLPYYLRYRYGYEVADIPIGESGVKELLCVLSSCECRFGSGSVERDHILTQTPRIPTITKSEVWGIWRKPLVYPNGCMKSSDRACPPHP
ncbi:MAG: hypothetical protein Kow00121_30320 [Elainellaceae cyanobacterium]